MRKGRAIFLLITLVVAIGDYMAWATLEPTPTLQSMTFHKNVDADGRSAAEQDFRSHPPKALEFMWQRFWNRLANPYQPRELSIPVWMVGEVIWIGYPRETVSLVRSRNDVTWIWSRDIEARD